jgi:hypothetical protein
VVLEMIKVLKKYSLILMMPFSIMVSMPVLSASTDVLDINEITNADMSTLLDDTKVFNTIGMGIALSIALCDGKEICDPTVDENEIGQLIETLDKRIEGVVTRQQNSEEELTNIITAYVDTKEKYTDYMDRLSKITKSPVIEEDLGDEDIFADDEAMTEDEYSAFNDSDENLMDDEDLEDDMDLDEVEEVIEDE